jgi:RsiW-degrading membrane proteinase PrsW (M82 family)
MESNAFRVARVPIAAVACAALLWLYIGCVLLGVLHNVALLPVWLVLGSVTVPGAILLTMTAVERRRPILSGNFLLLAATGGGVVAIIVGGTIDSLIQPFTSGGLVDDHALLLAGFIEEGCKLLVVLILGRRLQAKTVIQGLMLGAAVGLGFAAFEDMGYAMAPFLNHSFTASLLAQSGQDQLVRQLFTPFGHPLWSALLGGAVFAASRDGRYEFRWRILLAYVGVATAHGAWDGAATLGTRVLGPSGAVAATVLVWTLTAGELFVLWRVLYRPRTQNDADSPSVGGPQLTNDRPGR